MQCCRKLLIATFVFFLSLSLSGDALNVGELSCLEKMQPGETRRVKISIFNEKDTPELAELTLHDYECNGKGENFYRDPGELARSSTPWVHLSANRVQLQPKTGADVYLTIEVPKDDTLKGSYWNVVMVTPVEAVKSPKEEKEGFKLHIRTRFAYHAVITIGDKGAGKLKIDKKEIVAINKKKYLAVHVLNSGEIYLYPKLTIKLYNEQGKLEKTLNGSNQRLYPGSTSKYLVDVDGVDPKSYKAFLALDNGDKYVFGDSFKLEIPKDLPLAKSDPAKSEDNKSEGKKTEEKSTDTKAGNAEAEKKQIIDAAKINK